jgi:hypothetical protein
MNVTNVKAAIEIMKNAKNLRMENWQSSPPQYRVGEGGQGYWLVTTTEELHTCGNTACFAGYVAVSPQFTSEHGSGVSAGGAPILDKQGRRNFGEGAIRVWLDISHFTADALVHGDYQDEDNSGYCSFYGKEFQDVTPVDVIAKLEMILEGDLV